MFQELVERFTCFKVIEQVLKGNTRATEAGNSPEDLRIANDDRRGRVSPYLYILTQLVRVMWKLVYPARL